jgi:hypothetical protein
MNKLIEFFKNYGTMIITGLLLLILLKQCAVVTTQKGIKKEISTLDSTLHKEIKIEGLKTSKRMLYDNNAIIRTTIRPDDKMNEYDAEIKALENSK